MKELYSHYDFTRIGHLQSILESEGIHTHVKNQNLTTIMTSIPIQEFYPTLCVMDESDYQKAIDILTPHIKAYQEASAEPSPAPKKIVFIGLTLILTTYLIFAFFNLTVGSRITPGIILLCLAGALVLICVWRITRNALKNNQASD